MMRGNFDDVIFDCPHDIQELVTSADVCLALKKLNEGQKEILYYAAIRQWSHQRIAAYRGQSDRNIRKVYATLIAKIHKEMEKMKDEKLVSKDKLPLDTVQRICREKS